MKRSIHVSSNTSTTRCKASVSGTSVWIVAVTFGSANPAACGFASSIAFCAAASVLPGSPSVANIALATADFGYVLEVGRVVMEDRCEALLRKDDIREFYLGIKAESARGERRWKKKKQWR